MRRFCRVCAVLLAAMAVFVLFGLDNSLTVTFYTVDSGRLSAPLRLACISDLHSCDYGPGQRELLDAVEAAAPDLVVLTGDILDDELPTSETGQTSGS